MLVYKAYKTWIRPHYAYSDSGFYSEQVQARSQFGYCTFLGNDLIHWKSKLASTVATSTTMAELDGVFNCLTQCLWEDNIYKFLEWTEGPFTIFIDNEPLFRILTSEKQLDRTKHEAVKIEFIREKVKEKFVVFRKCDSKSNKADLFTKALQRNNFIEGVKNLGMIVNNHN